MNIEKYNGKDACKFLGIKINGEWVVVDENDDICLNDYFLVGGKIEQCLSSSEADDLSIGEQCPKIISASQSLIDKYQMNVPVLVSKEEQDIENIVCELIREFEIGLDHPNISAYDDDYVKRSYKEGVSRFTNKILKANQNRHSEDDVRKAIELARSKNYICLADGKEKLCDCKKDSDCCHRHYKNEDEIIQSLNQREVWLEVEDMGDFKGDNTITSWVADWQLKLTNNKIYEL